MKGIYLFVKDITGKLPAKVQEAQFPDNTDATYQDLANSSLANFGSVIQKQNIETSEIWNVIEIDFPSYATGEMGSLKYLADRDELYILKKDEIGMYFQEPVIEEEDVSIDTMY